MRQGSTDVARWASWPARVAVLAVLMGVCGCGPEKAAGPAADAAGVAAASITWKQTFNAGDPAAVTALYAEDAILSAPGVPLVRGRAAIGRYFVKTAADFSAAGLSVADVPLGAAVASGDLGYQWKTYTITDRTGAVVGSGRLLTLFQRSAGKWLIIADTWNADGKPSAAATH